MTDVTTPQGSLFDEFLRIARPAARILRGGRARLSDPPTSHQAAETVNDPHDHLPFAIIEVIRLVPSCPPTSDQVIKRLQTHCPKLKVSPSRVRTVIAELARDSRIEVAGTGESELGNAARTWKVAKCR